MFANSCVCLCRLSGVYFRDRQALVSVSPNAELGVEKAWATRGQMKNAGLSRQKAVETDKDPLEA